MLNLGQLQARDLEGGAGLFDQGCHAVRPVQRLAQAIESLGDVLELLPGNVVELQAGHDLGDGGRDRGGLRIQAASHLLGLGLTLHQGLVTGLGGFHDAPGLLAAAGFTIQHPPGRSIDHGRQPHGLIADLV
ncbi:MAG: hypothetical protein BWY87_00560 [Deltaproteobacteria bacterium ADurb.Bin510]|nr:MAG: hypothetical protein BWY87_00560 [Deltaproteobacteria bacterium ADurb.Bin510]